MYVVKDLLRTVTCRDILEHILGINHINVMYVVKDLVRAVTCRDTLEHILAINRINVIQYSQGHTMINHCDRRITLLSDNDKSFVLFNISSKFLFLFRVLLAITQNAQESKYT